MFDFILRWFGKGKPKEDTSAQDQSLSLFGESSLFATDKESEAPPAPAEETERVVTPSSTPQADSALQAKVEELTARLARTKKALEKAEEENEELEEECEQTLKRERAKTQEVKEQVSAMEKQLSETNKEKEKLKNELTATEERDNCRGQALSFVREVLIAQVTSERSELEQKVEEIVSFIHSDDCRKYITLTDEEKSDLSMWQSECAKSWIQGKVKVAFIGEFSAGKTSIVNRLLQEGDPHAIQLPVSSKATTAIPTYISGRKGGGKATYRFYTPDSILKEISEDTFRRVSKEVLEEVGGVSSMIKYFVMAYANKGLERLSILDTPGQGTAVRQHHRLRLAIYTDGGKRHLAYRTTAQDDGRPGYLVAVDGQYCARRQLLIGFRLRVNRHFPRKTLVGCFGDLRAKLVGQQAAFRNQAVRRYRQAAHARHLDGGMLQQDGDGRFVRQLG